jgi:hypothetical protein
LTVAFCFTSYSEAQICAGLFAPRGRIRTNDLIEIGIRIKARSDQINPSQTHIPELVGVVEHMAEHVDLAIRERRRLPKQQKELLLSFAQEIAERVAQRKVTYEWQFGMSMRVSYAARSYDKGWYHSISVEGPLYLAPTTYASHDSFMAAVGEVSALPSDQSGLRPSLAKMGDMLKSFPDKIFLGTPLNLGYASMNRITARKIFPGGMIRKPQDEIGGQDAFDFIQHDLGHALSARLGDSFRDKVEVESLKKIDAMSGSKHQLFHLFHFLIFHENGWKNIVQDQVANLPSALNFFDTFIETTSIHGRKTERENYPSELFALPRSKRNAAIRDVAGEFVDHLRLILDVARQ